MGKNVVIIGIDGFDPDMLQRAIASGDAPHAAELQRSGTFQKLSTTNPAQSPVAWASLATGVNPGGHGLFDFIGRSAGTYLPRLSLLDPNTHNILGKKSSMFRPVLGGTPFWSVSSSAGVPTSVLKWPVNFPPLSVRGNALSGLGVPDLRTTLGKYTYYTSVPGEAKTEDAKGDIIIIPSENHVETFIYGPNKAKAAVVFDADTVENTLTITVHSKAYAVPVGQWSPWIRVEFAHLLGQRIAGMCRFHVVSTAPALRVYATSLHADPRKSAFPISYPDSYASELAERIGPYHTLGLPEETNGVIDERLSYDAFASFIDDIQKEREAIFWDAFGKFHNGCFAFVFDTIDRAQHIFWMTQDNGHPLFTQQLQEHYQRVIGDFYRRMDGLLGKILAQLPSETLLLVVSDHGFNTFRRAVHINSWLRLEGFLTLKDGTVGAPLFANVDWKKTKAYALGFSGLFLNRAGREQEGIVAESDVPVLQQELALRLTQLRDPQNGEQAIHSVLPGAELYKGKYMVDAPDLVIGYKPGYRASWQTTVGAAPETIIEDNVKKWSGDHLIDPSFVPGVVLSNQPLAVNEPSVLDLAPTVTAALGVPPAAEWEGKSWVENIP